MCSVEEDEQGLEPATRAPISNKHGRTCMKCSSTVAVVVVRLNDALCKSCFLTYFTHKFRATIGKARVVQHDERVLLAISGGPSSLAMLHLVSEGVGERVTRKLRFHPGVVFIDEGTVLGLSDQERGKIEKELGQIAKEKGFVFYNVSLDVLCKTSTLEEKQTLQCIVESVTSLTAKEDLLKSLRQHLLIQVAMKEGYTKIMVADCANRIAVRLLSDISQGRGAALPFDTGFVDNRHGDIKILRPMREFIAKEISLYNLFNGIEAINIPSLTTKSHSYASIDRLTEKFISGLQAEFPFTVSTVFRTGDKLTVKDDSDDLLNCTLCGVPMVLSAATALSSQLGQVKLDSGSGPGNAGDDATRTGKENRTESKDITGKECCGSCSGACCATNTQSWQPSRELFMATLCYGCHLTVKDTKGPTDGLPFVVDAVKKHVKRAEMKEQIKDFLLQDNTNPHV